MSTLMEQLRTTIAKDFGVTLTDTHLTVRHEKGIATFVLASVTDWGDSECAMCGCHVEGEPNCTMEINRGKIMKAKVRVCSDCRCPK